MKKSIVEKRFAASMTPVERMIADRERGTPTYAPDYINRTIEGDGTISRSNRPEEVGRHIREIEPDSEYAGRGRRSWLDRLFDWFATED